MSRPLSSIEQVNWLIDQVVSISFIMVARVSGELPETILRQALDIVQEKYPPLKWKIKEGDIPEFSMEGVPKIPLRIIERRNENHWIEEAEKEMHDPFPWSEGPLVRVVQLVSPDKTKCELLLTFCHVATDATSGVMVVKQLLDIADKLSRGETVNTPPQPEPLSSIELIKKDLTFEPHPLDTAGSTTPPKSVILKGDKDVPPEQRTTRIIHKVLSEADTKKLVTRSKQEKTSVHGALCAAFFQAVMEQVRKGKEVPEKGPLSISCVTPVDIRHHFTQHMEEDIGYYISFALHYQLIDENESLWPAARAVREAILTEIKSGKDVEAIRAVGDQWKEYSTPLEMVRGQNKSYPPVAATNLGRLNVPEQFGELALEELHYTVAISSATQSGLAFAVTTHRGHLTINFLYSVPYISDERANIIVESTMKRLRDAVT